MGERVVGNRREGLGEPEHVAQGDETERGSQQAPGAPGGGVDAGRRRGAPGEGHDRQAGREEGQSVGHRIAEFGPREARSEGDVAEAVGGERAEQRAAPVPPQSGGAEFGQELAGGTGGRWLENG